MEEINAPLFRLQMAISDCIKNRSSMETLEKLDLGVISKTYKNDCWLYFPHSIPSHKNDLKRLAEHWIIMSICRECDPRKVFQKNLNATINAALLMGLENIDLKQYQSHPK